MIIGSRSRASLPAPNNQGCVAESGRRLNRLPGAETYGEMIAIADAFIAGLAALRRPPRDIDPALRLLRDDPSVSVERLAASCSAQPAADGTKLQGTNGPRAEGLRAPVPCRRGVSWQAATPRIGLAVDRCGVRHTTTTSTWPVTSANSPGSRRVACSTRSLRHQRRSSACGTSVTCRTRSRSGTSDLTKSWLGVRDGIRNWLITAACRRDHSTNAW